MIAQIAGTLLLWFPKLPVVLDFRYWHALVNIMGKQVVNFLAYLQFFEVV